MKKVLSTLVGLSFVLMLGIQTKSYAQNGQCLISGACQFTNSNQWPQTTQSTNSGTFVELAPDMWPGDFAVCDVVFGTTYEWSLCDADGGNAITYDAQITLYNGTTNNILCYSDDLCGNKPKIRYTAAFTGTVKLQLNEFNCIQGTEQDTRIMWRAIASTQNDAEVSLIYSQGTVSTSASSPFVVRALVTNNGSTALSNLPVTLAVTGANTFNNTVNVANIPVGGRATVTFQGYPLAATGVCTLRVSVPSDGNNTNNFRLATQNVTTNELSYEEGSTSTGGAGFTNNTGEVASKFNINGTRSIDQLTLRFNTTGISYQAKIFSVNANGEPLTELFTTANLATVNGQVNIPVSPAVSVSNSFFIVVRQVGTTNFGLLYQEESPLRLNTFFFRSGTTTTWSDLSVSNLNFRSMVGARLTTGGGNPQDGECLTVGACQFTNTNQWPQTTQSTSSAAFVELSPDMWPGDFAVCNVINGTTYEWSLCTADGGDVAYDAQFTLFNGTTDALLCFSDDFCGDRPKIRYTATFTGTVKLQVNEFNCLEGRESDTRVMWRTVSTIQNDAEVSLIYSQGTVSTLANSPFVVRAIVTNNGLSAISNLNVTLGVTGSNTFNNTVNVASIPVGGRVTVTFPAFTLASTGTNNITVSVPNDGNNTNNSSTATQIVTTNQLSYEEGTTPTNGAGFNNSVGEIASKFTINGTRNIDQITLRFNTAGASYQVKIFGVDGSGAPSTELFTTANRTAAIGQVNIPVSPALSVTNAFFVVVRQVNPTPNMGLAYQTENPLRSNTFFFRSGTTTTWTDFSASNFNFRMMVGARIGGCTPPAAPGSISGNPNVCQGTSNSYSVAPVAGADTYTWTLPGGWTGSSTSNTINSTAGASNGIISVTANSTQCGSSAASTLNVSASTTPVIIGGIRGATGACSGASILYSVAPVAGATSYTWTLPAGWGGSSTVDSIRASIGSAGGTIAVTANNLCGTSQPVTLQATIVTLPGAPANITGEASICSGSSNTYTAAPVAGSSSYEWTLPSGWTGTSTSNVINTTAGTTGGNIQVRAVNTCGRSNQTSLSVIVNSSGSAAFNYGATAYCLGGNNPSGNPTTPGGVFSASPNGLVFANSQTGEINLQTSQPGNYVVTYTTPGTCSSTSSSQIALTRQASTAFTYSAATYCSNVALNPAPQLAPGATLGTFSATPAGLTINATTGVITLSSSAPGTYTVTNSIAASGGCDVATSTFSVTVNAAPTASVSGGATICSDGSQTVPVTITLTGTAPFNFTYSVSGSPTPITGYASNTFVINAAASGTYTVTTVQDASTCQNTGTGNAVVTINQRPTVTLNPFPNTLCIFDFPFTPTNGTPAGGTYSGPGVFNNQLTPALAGVGIHTLVYTITSPQNCIGSDSIEFEVDFCTSTNQTIDNSIHVWPVPASNRVFVALDGMNASNTQFSVLGLDGKTIELSHATTFQSGQAQIVVGELPKGLYQLVITHNDNLYKRMISVH